MIHNINENIPSKKVSMHRVKYKSFAFKEHLSVGWQSLLIAVILTRNKYNPLYMTYAFTCSFSPHNMNINYLNQVSKTPVQHT